MTETEIKSQILQILGAPQYYIMAGGGEGMTYLSHLISHNSPRFSPGAAKTNGDNIYYNNMPNFYKIFGYNIAGTVDDFVNNMYKILILNIPENDIQRVLNQAVTYHQSLINGPALLTTHYNPNDYFTVNNTWYLHLDEFRWFEYKWMLWFTKVWNYMIPIEDVKSVINSRKVTYHLRGSPKEAIFDELYTKIIQSGATSVPEGLIAYVEFSDDSFTTLPNEYLSIPVSELVSSLIPTIPSAFAYRTQTLTTHNTLNNLNIINYSRIFELGYLEDMFDIPGTSFNTQWTSWHTKNLEIIAAHGHSTANFQL